MDQNLVFKLVSALLILSVIYYLVKKDDKPKPGSKPIRVVDQTNNPQFKKRIEIILATIMKYAPDEYQYIAGGYNTVYLVNGFNDVFGSGIRPTNALGAYCDGACFLFAASAGTGVEQNVITLGHEAWHPYNKSAPEHRHHEADDFGRQLYSKVKGKFGQ